MGPSRTGKILVLMDAMRDDCIGFHPVQCPRDVELVLLHVLLAHNRVSDKLHEIYEACGIQ